MLIRTRPARRQGARRRAVDSVLRSRATASAGDSAFCSRVAAQQAWSLIAQHRGGGRRPCSASSPAQSAGRWQGTWGRGLRSVCAMR